MEAMGENPFPRRAQDSLIQADPGRKGSGDWNRGLASLLRMSGREQRRWPWDTGVEKEVQAPELAGRQVPSGPQGDLCTSYGLYLTVLAPQLGGLHMWSVGSWRTQLEVSGDQLLRLGVGALEVSPVLISS